MILLFFCEWLENYHLFASPICGKRQLRDEGHDVRAGRDAPSSPSRLYAAKTARRSKPRCGARRARWPRVRDARMQPMARRFCNATPWFLPASGGRPKARQKCPEHGEVLKFLCMTCDVVSCTDCMNFGLHKGHVHELVTAVAEGHRSQLQEHVRAAEAAEVARAHRCVCSLHCLARLCSWHRHVCSHLGASTAQDDAAKLWRDLQRISRCLKRSEFR